MDDLGERLTAAGTDLQALRGELVAREPWPLSRHYGTEPEADWGPREVLAHVAEMLPYWTAELRRVVAGRDGRPVPFGRVAGDANRLARIERDRRRTSGELLDDVAAGVAETRSFVDGLSPADFDRVGVHPTRGELSVGESLDRFVCSHLAEHVSQLRTILDRRGEA